MSGHARRVPQYPESVLWRCCACRTTARTTSGALPPGWAKALDGREACPRCVRRAEFQRGRA